jgi:hypothetical protein
LVQREFCTGSISALLINYPRKSPARCERQAILALSRIPPLGLLNKHELPSRPLLSFGRLEKDTLGRYHFYSFTTLLRMFRLPVYARTIIPIPSVPSPLSLASSCSELLFSTRCGHMGGILSVNGPVNVHCEVVLLQVSTAARMNNYRGMNTAEGGTT